ncbi:MAG: class I tRNA ligase family protein, partial [Oscillospiraceae bacterium]
RYWGEPIPIVHCPKCGDVAVPYEELPLKLPPVDNFKPGEDGESPLAKIDSFVQCKCPKCGGDAKRETDTMPQWAGSSWYFLRYCDPKNENVFASKEALEYWMPVDWYNGGMEHVTRHMIYSRFWHRFLYDIGEVNTPEPYAKRTAQGLILGSDGEKMSKSRGNVVDPNDVVDEYGADVLRLYVLFMGDYEQAAPWNESSMKGCKRFLDRIWNMSEKLADGEEYSDKLRSAMHKVTKKVSEDIEGLKFNTAIAAMMGLLNEADAAGGFNRAEFRTLLMLLNPFAPHITEELYEQLGYGGVLNEQAWPEFDEKLCIDSTVELAVQINGKVKARFNAPVDSDSDTLIAMALELDDVKPLTEGKTIVKKIAVPNKLVNIVVK